MGGRADESPLTALGERQAAQLGAAGLPASTSCWFTSTAVRTRETARLAREQLCQRSGGAQAGGQAAAAPMVHARELLEIDMGAFSGRRRAECYTPGVQKAIERDCHNFAPPGGESQRQVEERVVRYIETEVLPRCEGGGPPAVVVAHGVAIKCFLRRILGSDAAMTWKIQLNNTSITEVGLVEDPEDARAGWHLLRVNDHAHTREWGDRQGH